MASCNDKGSGNLGGDDNEDINDNEYIINHENNDDNLVLVVVEVDYNENGDDNQTTLCLLGWTLSLLRAPGIRRNVRVAATCHDHNDEYLHHKHEDDDDNYGYLVVLLCSEEQVGDY